MCKYRPVSQYLHISYKSFSISLKQMYLEAGIIETLSDRRFGNIDISRVKKFKNLFAGLSCRILSIFECEFLHNVWSKLLADCTIFLTYEKNRERVKDFVLISLQSMCPGLYEFQNPVRICTRHVGQYKCFIVHVS